MLCHDATCRILPHLCLQSLHIEHACPSERKPAAMMTGLKILDQPTRLVKVFSRIYFRDLNNVGSFPGVADISYSYVLIKYFIIYLYMNRI